MGEIKNMVLVPKIDYAVTKSGYDIDNQIYPRVTSIINVISKPGLRYWYGKLGTEEAQRYMQDRSTFGSAMHDMIENLAMIDSRDKANRFISRCSNEEMEECLRAFMDWRKYRTLGERQVETVVYSSEYDYAGTFDFLGRVDGDLLLADWKSSKQIYPSYFLQLSAYANAVREMVDVFPDKAGVLCLRGDRTYEYKWMESDTLKAFFHIFLSAKRIYGWRDTGWMNVINEEHSRPEKKRITDW